MRKSPVFELARKTRDDYKRFWKSNEDRRAAELKKTVDVFKPGARQMEEMAAVKAKFDDRLETERARLKMKFDDAVTRDRAILEEKIQRVPSDSLRVLATLNDLPLSQRELVVLSEQFGKKNMWMDKALSVLADRNNLDIDGLIDIPVDVALEVLDELEDAVHNFLENHTDDFSSITTDSRVSDNTIFRLEESVYKQSRIEFTPKEMADRYLARCASSPDIMAQTKRLANAWNHADEATRKEILRCLDSGRFRIYDDAVRNVGLTEALEDFRGNGNGARQQAKHVVERLKNAADAGNLSWAVVGRIIQAENATGNAYLVEEIKAAFGENPEINRVLEVLSVPGAAGPVSVSADKSSGDTAENTVVSSDSQ